jgi:hypothetical protein
MLAQTKRFFALIFGALIGLLIGYCIVLNAPWSWISNPWRRFEISGDPITHISGAKLFRSVFIQTKSGKELEVNIEDCIKSFQLDPGNCPSPTNLNDLKMADYARDCLPVYWLPVTVLSFSIPSECVLLPYEAPLGVSATFYLLDGSSRLWYLERKSDILEFCLLLPSCLVFPFIGSVLAIKLLSRIEKSS